MKGLRVYFEKNFPISFHFKRLKVQLFTCSYMICNHAENVALPKKKKKKKTQPVW